ncbi:MAG: amino acid permease [Gammaproteobacteria bacterium]|nr:amino acid permease [Gammaproteobacteria bacterium]
MTRPAINKFAYTTVTAVVIANMVGTGVFTSLGFQLLELRSGFVLLALWAVGGLIALCGAMTYAELGAAMPRSGGEYNFLTRIYHPGVGFVSGWVSATIGFAAPTALAAMTFAAYTTSVLPQPVSSNVEKAIAAALVLIMTGVHSSSRRQSGGLQSVFTVLKVGGIVVFCLAALLLVDERQAMTFLPISGDMQLLSSGAFAISLIYVSYAYTGWNAATYLSSELDNPQRDLPRILFAGTAVVTFLYVALNYVFLSVAPIDAMRGEVEIGFIAAESAFGPAGGRFAGLALALLLISTVSAMTLAGPRVLQVIGEDFPALKFLSRSNSDGLPYVAIWTQSALTLVFILTSGFESILVFAGFTLALNSFVTVLGVFVLRWRQPELERPYRTFGYPVTPVIYLLLTGWTLGYVLYNRPAEGAFGLALILSGFVVFALAGRRGVREA